MSAGVRKLRVFGIGGAAAVVGGVIAGVATQSVSYGGITGLGIFIFMAGMDALLSRSESRLDRELGL